MSDQAMHERRLGERTLGERVRTASRPSRDALALALRLALRRAGPAPALGLAAIVAAVALHFATARMHDERGRIAASMASQDARRRAAVPASPASAASSPADALDAFLAVLAGPGEGVALAQAMWDEAGRAGVRLSRLEFVDAPQAGGLFVRHEIRVPVEGDEHAIRQFAWTLMAAHPALALERLEWRRDPAGGGLQAKLGFCFYTRRGA